MKAIEILEAGTLAGMAKRGEVYLKTLKMGEWFLLGDKKGHVVYSTHGWVKVCFGSKPVTINGEVQFFQKSFIEISPETAVKRIEPDSDPEVTLDEDPEVALDDPEIVLEQEE